MDSFFCYVVMLRGFFVFFLLFVINFTFETLLVFPGVLQLEMRRSSFCVIFRSDVLDSFVLSIRHVSVVPFGSYPVLNAASVMVCPLVSLTGCSW